MTTIPTIGTFSVFLLRVFKDGFFSGLFLSFFLSFTTLRLKLGSSGRTRETAKVLVHSFSFEFEGPKTTKNREEGVASQKKFFTLFLRSI